MPVWLKIPVCFFVFAAAYFFSYWAFFIQILPESMAFFAWLSALATGGAAAFAVWRGGGGDAGGILAVSVRWAAIAGGVGFCGGFFGPLIFAPGANQGPLLGLFITGPLGFFGGGICGLVYGWWKNRA